MTFVVTAELAADVLSNVSALDLGAAVEEALRDTIPASDRNDTTVVVTLSEAGVAVLTVPSGADLDDLTERVTARVCEATVTCNVTLSVAPVRLRRLDDTDAAYAIDRSYATGGTVAALNDAITAAAAAENATVASGETTMLRATAEVSQAAALFADELLTTNGTAALASVIASDLGVDMSALMVSSALQEQAAPVTTTGTATDDAPGGGGGFSRIGLIAVGVAAGLTILLAVALVIVHVRHPRGLKGARLPFRVSIRRSRVTSARSSGLEEASLPSLEDHSDRRTSGPDANSAVRSLRSAGHLRSIVVQRGDGSRRELKQSDSTAKGLAPSKAGSQKGWHAGPPFMRSSSSGRSSGLEETSGAAPPPEPSPSTSMRLSRPLQPELTVEPDDGALRGADFAVGHVAQRQWIDLERRMKFRI